MADLEKVYFKNSTLLLHVSSLNGYEIMHNISFQYQKGIDVDKREVKPVWKNFFGEILLDLKVTKKF